MGCIIMKVNFATVCMNVSQNKEINLQKFLKYIDEAADNGANLIVFPEQSLQGYLTNVCAMDMSNSELNEFHIQYKNAETVPLGNSVQRITKKAIERKIYVVFGMTEKDSDVDYKLYNTAVLVGPNGYIGKYRKVHQPVDECHVYYSGKKFPVFQTDIGRIGMLICYDKWLPESTRELALAGADILIMPTATAFTDPVKKDHNTDYAYYTYDLMDRVRALENQTFFISANQTGICGNSTYFGYSNIIAPTGKVAATTADKEGIAYYTTEDMYSEIYYAKNCFAGCNFLKDRKPDLYKNAINATNSSNYSFIVSNDVLK